MSEPIPSAGKILITGGTSGLGLGLAKYFLKIGFEVFATGRRNVTMSDYGDRFRLLIADFSNLRQTSESVKEICKSHRFDIVINNAGVLSPPDPLLTENGLEYTFQVNFLAHLMLDEIIIRNAVPGFPLLIASIVSPVYRIAEKDMTIPSQSCDYKPLIAYSNSKLYLALMCSYLSHRYSSADLKCVGFDPGVFSSRIYRMQKGWFRMMYGIAAPFMRNPDRIAADFGELIKKVDLVNGYIYKSGKRKGIHPVSGNQLESTFWQDCIGLIESYLD